MKYMLLMFGVFVSDVQCRLSNPDQFILAGTGKNIYVER